MMCSVISVLRPAISVASIRYGWPMSRADIVAGPGPDTGRNGYALIPSAGGLEVW